MIAPRLPALLPPAPFAASRASGRSPVARARGVPAIADGRRVLEARDHHIRAFARKHDDAFTGVGVQVERAVLRHHPRVADASLKRAKLESIDLFYKHRVEPEVPIEEAAGAVKELIREAKVKRFGFTK